MGLSRVGAKDAENQRAGVYERLVSFEASDVGPLVFFVRIFCPTENVVSVADQSVPFPVVCEGKLEKRVSETRQALGLTNKY